MRCRTEFRNGDRCPNVAEYACLGGFLWCPACVPEGTVRAHLPGGRTREQWAGVLEAIRVPRPDGPPPRAVVSAPWLPHLLDVARPMVWPAGAVLVLLVASGLVSLLLSGVGS